MILKKLTLIKFEQETVPNDNPAYGHYDAVIVTTITETEDIYNLDQIFTVDECNLYERTNIGNNKVQSYQGKRIYYLIIKFINGEIIKVKGTLEELKNG